MSRCMEWLWLDRVANVAEWLSPDEWRLRDIDQQIRYYHGEQRRQAEQARRQPAAVVAPSPAARQGRLAGVRR